MPGEKRQATRRLMEIMDQLEAWVKEEDLLQNSEEERVRAWQERILFKSKRLREVEEDEEGQ